MNRTFTITSRKGALIDRVCETGAGELRAAIARWQWMLQEPVSFRKVGA